MIDFSKLEIIENPNGGATLIFDLEDPTLKELELILDESRDSNSFQEKFQNFVICALTSYLSIRNNSNE